MKRKNKSEQSEKKRGKKSESKKEEERKPCNACKWYDWSTQRDFHRRVGSKDESGERIEIVEVRAVCRNPKARAYNRFVHATLTKRECPHFEEGRYEQPKKETEEKTKKESEPTSPNEYFGDVFERPPT